MATRTHATPSSAPLHPAHSQMPTSMKPSSVAQPLNMPVQLKPYATSPVLDTAMRPAKPSSRRSLTQKSTASCSGRPLYSMTAATSRASVERMMASPSPVHDTAQASQA
ncbi:hypothetical protein SEVIR_7G276102v4 [Setaria viridis]